MSTVIDFHSHVLPGIDDGSSSVEMSVSMLEKEASQGITHVVATPHFYAQHDTPERFLRKRAEAETLLREEMTRHEGLPKLTVGAEVYFFQGMSESDILRRLTIGNGKCILIEMPLPPWTDRMYREVEHIREKQGLIPIIAHVDRYIAPFRTYQIPERLSRRPVIVQANASFFLRRATRRMAFQMLRDGEIHLLGSDCHDLSDRAPNLGEAVCAITKRLGEDAVSRINAVEKDILAECVF